VVGDAQHRLNSTTILQTSGGAGSPEAVTVIGARQSGWPDAPYDHGARLEPAQTPRRQRVLTIQAAKGRTLAIVSDLDRCRMQLEQNGSTAFPILPGLSAVGRYSSRLSAGLIGAVLLYQLAILYRFQQGLAPCIGLKAFLKAA
jgi:hypothetical protein